MANKSKADLIGEVLKGLAYRDLDVGAYGEPLISDYDPGPLADRQWVLKKASEQSERHVLLHHGLASEGDESKISDEWCFECTRNFLSATVGEDVTQSLIEAAQGMGKIPALSTQESAISLSMKVLSHFDEQRIKAMREATRAVRYREGFAEADAEIALKSWDADRDRIVDFYAEWIGSRFAGMVDRAEQLNAITTKGEVPPVVRRYIIEASKCFILGQYLASLLVCRSVLRFLSLEEFLVREGKARDLEALRKSQTYAVAPLVEIAQTLGRWRLQPTLDDALEVGRAANEAVHKSEPKPERCRDLFIKTRGILKELYA